MCTRLLPNGAIEVQQIVRYGPAECEARFTVLPHVTERGRHHILKTVERQHLLRLIAEKQRAAAAEARAAAAFYAHIVPKVERMRARGLTFATIPTLLNDEGEPTRTGVPWSGALVNGALQSRR